VTGDVEEKEGLAVKNVLLALALLTLTACATYCTQDRIDQIWTEVSSQYPGCNKKPNIIAVDNGMMGAFYLPDMRTIVIDKWSLPEVWRHEFRHACGDDPKDEAPLTLHGSSIDDLMLDYMIQTEQIRNN